MGNFFWITLWEKGFELDIELKQTFLPADPESLAVSACRIAFTQTRREQPKVKLRFRSSTTMDLIKETALDFYHLFPGVENI